MKKIITVLLCSIVVSCSTYVEKPEVITVDYKSADAPQKFYQSLRDTGFAVIENHPIAPELLEKIRNEWKAFFANSEINKSLYHHTNHPQTMLGYYPLGIENAAGSTQQKNQMEYFHYALNQGVLSGTLDEVTARYFRDMLKLCKQLLVWLDQEMDKNVALPKGVTNLQGIMTDALPYTITRILHYPAASSNDKETVVNVEHTDISMLSLLFATRSGLQVKDNNGNWHSVGGDPAKLVVNAGDMLKWATQGHIRSTIHRVVRQPGDAEERFSFPVFVGMNPDVKFADGRTVKEAFIERIQSNGINVEGVKAGE
jgi:isopenicillin N synthase-like dioxygenase